MQHNANMIQVVRKGSSPALSKYILTVWLSKDNPFGLYLQLSLANIEDEPLQKLVGFVNGHNFQSDILE